MMHYKITGAGEAVILIHGLFGSLDNLNGLANQLKKQFKVIQVDLPNHGESSAIDNMSYQVLADKIALLINKLSLDSCHLVGHSMGGKVAMATALSYPERVQSLTVLDIAPVCYPRRHDHIFTALRSIDISTITNRTSLLDKIQKSGVDKDTAQFLLKSAVKQLEGFRWKFNLEQLFNDYEQILAWPYQEHQFIKPTFFIRGGDSDYISSTHRDEILQQFPRVTAKTINGAGHWLHVQKPFIVNRLIDEFILRNINVN